MCDHSKNKMRCNFRAGISTKAIQSIRKNEAVTKVIYVTPDPHAVMKNFADLAMSPSINFKVNLNIFPLKKCPKHEGHPRAPIFALK